MEQRIFLFQNVYVRLVVSGSLTPTLTTMTAAEVELYTKTNRDVLIIHFKTGVDPAPAFFNHGPARVKVINLTGAYQDLFEAKDRELSGCFETAVTWLIGVNPDKGFYSVFDQLNRRS
jgi:hypothetical protein